MSSRRVRELFAVIALSTVLCLGLVLRVTPIPHDQLVDSLSYIAMAERPFTFHTAPYCYRILVPTLASVPPGQTAAFFLLTLCFVGATGVLVYYLLRTMAMSRLVATLGLLMFFGLNWGPRFAFFDFRLPDPALFFFATLALLVLMQGRHGYFVLVVTIGVLSKESALFLLPYPYTQYARRVVDVRALRRALLMAIVPVTVLVAVRLLIPAQYHPADLLSTIGKNRIEHDMAGFVRAGTVGTWGVSLLVACSLAGQLGRAWFLRSVPFLTLVYLQPFFATNVDRLLVLGFVAIIPLAAMGWSRMLVRFGLAPWMAVGYVLIPYALLLVKKGTRYNSPAPEQELLFLALWTTVVWLSKRRTNAADVPPTEPDDRPLPARVGRHA